MTDDRSSKKIVKATLEATFGAQERLRKHLDVLIEENRPLKDSAERDLFLRELTYSTLGLGKDFQINLNIPGEYLGIRKDLETVGRWLAYQQTKEVWVPMDLYKNLYRNSREKNVEIKFLWRMFLENLFTVFPHAIDRAMSLSKEQSEGQKSKGFQVNND